MRTGVDTCAVRGPTVGICEDDADVRSVVARALRDEDLEVCTATTGREAVESFSSTALDVLVLDVVLADADGRDVCRALRAHGVVAPVLFLTARGALVDRLAGFQAGGDDYLTKPFALEELVARVHALLNRSAGRVTSSDTSLRLDPAAHAVRAGERAEALTPTEFRLLAALVARPGAVVRRRQLVAAGWPHGALVHDNTLDAYLKRLRTKLKLLECAEEITTVRGVGYSFR